MFEWSAETASPLSGHTMGIVGAEQTESFLLACFSRFSSNQPCQIVATTVHETKPLERQIYGVGLPGWCSGSCRDGQLENRGGVEKRLSGCAGVPRCRVRRNFKSFRTQGQIPTSTDIALCAETETFC